MKERYRKILVFLCVVCFVLPVQAFAQAADADFCSALATCLETFDDPLVSNYGSYLLSWDTNAGYKNLLRISSDNASASIDVNYGYEENRRISKEVNGEITTYQYAVNGPFLGKMLSATNGVHDLTFTYGTVIDSDGSAVVRAQSFSYASGTYFYIYNESGTVTGLSQNGIRVIDYVYQNGIVSKVLAFENGSWVEKTGDTSSPGNVNPLRLYGYYFDEETQWYYCGRYYDAVHDCFVDGDYSISLPYTQLLVRSVPSSVQQQVSDLAVDCFSNPNFGTPIDATSGWYNSLTDTEILARLIYGENTFRTGDQSAVCWVVVNRLSSASHPNTLRDVMTQANQFSPISGSGTSLARCPDTTSAGWSNAVSLACIATVCVSYSNGTSYMTELMPPPNGITNQLYYRGLSYFLSHAVDGNGCLVLGNAILSQVTVPEVGTNYTAISQLQAISSPSTRNIFFNVS